MKKLYYIFLIIISFTLTNNISHAQDLTSYHMHWMHQKHQINPAMNGGCNFYLGFPGAAGINFGLETRGFQIGNILENPNNITEYIGDLNYINFHTDYNVFSTGFKVKKSFITFDASLKSDVNIGLSGDLLQLMFDGNEQFIGKTADVSGSGFSSTLYMEYALGYSRDINEKLRIGGKFKYLNGLTNISLQDWEGGLHTQDFTYEMSLASSASLNLAGPVEVVYDTDNPDQVSEINPLEETEDIIDYALRNNQNRGFGIDLGATYQFNDKLLLSASLIDLINTISWNDRVHNLNQDGEFYFDGINLTGPITGEDGGDDFENLMDSVMETFQISSTENSYNTSLSPKYYIGANYQLLTWLNAGALIKGHVVDGHHFMAYSVSANAKAGRVLSASLSGTLVGSNSMSIGAGFSVKLLPLQIYVMADNLNGIYYDAAENILWPGNTQTMNIKFGVNLAFGCKPPKED